MAGQENPYTGDILTNRELEDAKRTPINARVFATRTPGRDPDGLEYEDVDYTVYLKGTYGAVGEDRFDTFTREEGLGGSSLRLDLRYKYYPKPGDDGYHLSITDVSLGVMVTDGRYRSSEAPVDRKNPNMVSEVNSAGKRISEDNFAHEFYKVYGANTKTSPDSVFMTIRALLNAYEEAREEEEAEFNRLKVPQNQRIYTKGFPTEQGGVFAFMEEAGMEKHAAALVTALMVVTTGVTDEYYNLYASTRRNTLKKSPLGTFSQDGLLILPKEITSGMIGESMAVALDEITRQLKPKLQEIEVEEEPKVKPPFAYTAVDPNVLPYAGEVITERPTPRLIKQTKGFSLTRLYLGILREHVGVAGNAYLDYNGVARLLVSSPNSHFYQWAANFHGEDLSSESKLNITTPNDPVLRMAIMYRMREKAASQPADYGHFAKSMKHLWAYASNVLQYVSDFYSVMMSKRGYKLVVDRPSTNASHYGLTAMDFKFWSRYLQNNEYLRYAAGEVDRDFVEAFGENIQVQLLSSGTDVEDDNNY